MSPADHWGEYARKTIKDHTPRPLLLRALEQRGAGPRAARRTALDLGSGAGNETLALLERGWTVTALDSNAEALEVVRSRAAPDARLTLLHAPFHRLPRRRYALIHASLSLPFCPPELWQRTWRVMRSRVALGGLLAATFFGQRDGWAAEPEMSFAALEDVPGLLPGFGLEVLEEWEGETALALGGTHRSHLITVIARRGRAPEAAGGAAP
ncbi:class I SAM-dependent methyltransferase [Deinococcus koreensis]|nr:class I SAM-dependent methyltransferase [Deinococcus koreensis]